jgi:predicted RNA methylase
MLRTKRSVDFEQYFTDADLAVRCLAAVRERYDLGSFNRILEPSAGDGVFFKLLPEKSRIGIDIMPLCDGVQKMDFFRWEPPLFEDNILTIGNPPFGQRGAQAIAFMNRACEFSRVIAFIVPRSFKKDTFLNRVNPSFHLVEQFDCSGFRSPDGVPLEVKSVFQIWERRREQREQIKRSGAHGDFDLKHAHLSRITGGELCRLVADYDFAIAQVGSNFVPKEPKTLSAGSYWFVRANKPGVREVFERLDFSFLDGLNLSFTSLSKKDIIQAYESARR